MPLQIIRQDVTKMQVDAIVNPTNAEMVGYSGVDLAVHTLAGKKMDAECARLSPLGLGQAKITGAYNLPCKYVIHTSGPVWRGGTFGEADILRSCYIESLSLAVQNGCRSVAVPLISSGVYGFPKDQVLQFAVQTVTEFLLTNDLTVYICVFDRESYSFSRKLFLDIQAFIEDDYVNEQGRLFGAGSLFDADLSDALAGGAGNVKKIERIRRAERKRRAEAEWGVCPNVIKYSRMQPKKDSAVPPKTDEGVLPPTKKEETAAAKKKEETALPPTKKEKENSALGDSGADLAGWGGLKEYLRQMDKGFQETLFDLIDERGMTEVECYKRANVDKRVFSKIRSDKNYRPSKQTAVAFAIALRLDLDETQALLSTLGLTLSKSNRFDQIIRFFICNHCYNIPDINLALFEFDQPLLGAS